VSSLERNKGTLVYIGEKIFTKPSKLTEDEYEQWVIENSFMTIGEKLYKVTYEIQSEEDLYFQYVLLSGKRIHFHTIHYNGGASLEEVLTSAIEIEKKEAKRCRIKH
jgi:hypothetical protein